MSSMSGWRGFGLCWARWACCLTYRMLTGRVGDARALPLGEHLLAELLLLPVWVQRGR